LTVNRGRGGRCVELPYMGNSNNALIPRGEVFQRLRGNGLTPSDDRFDRFRAAGLIDELTTIPGTTQHGFTPDAAQRFFALLWLCKQLGTKRPRASALAFWLCWYGVTDVPPHLVCEHIERAVLTYLRFIRRQYGRRRVPQRNAQDPERWRKAGVTWAKPFIKEFLQSFVDNGVMLDLLATTVGFALRLLFSDLSFEAAAGIFKRVAFLFGAKETKMEAMRTIWNVAREVKELFVVDERANVLLKAVREVNAQTDPREIIGIVQDARLVLSVMGAVFPIYKTFAAEPATLDRSGEANVNATLNFAPAMCAVLALTRRGPHAIEMRQRLRDGDTGPVITEFQQIRVIRDSIIAHISKEPQS
jgi:hypothetical protein